MACLFVVGDSCGLVQDKLDEDVDVLDEEACLPALGAILCAISGIFFLDNCSETGVTVSNNILIVDTGESDNFCSLKLLIWVGWLWSSVLRRAKPRRRKLKGQLMSESILDHSPNYPNTYDQP